MKRQSKNLKCKRIGLGKIDGNPKVYVGSYEKYNNGWIDGEWVDLTDFSNIDEFFEYCAEIHADEEQPEFMFQDWENIPDGYIDEGYIDERLWDWISDMNDIDWDFDLNDDLEEYRNYSGNHDASYRDMQDAFIGEFDSEYDFGEYIAEEYNLSVEELRPYIDYDGVAQEYLSNGYFNINDKYYYNY